MKTLYIIANLVLFMNASSTRVPVNLTLTSEDTAVTFSIKNAGIQVDGSFSEVRGRIAFDPEALDESQIRAEVATKGIDTGMGLRDSHLRKAEYFHVQQYPYMRFESTRIEQAGSDQYVAHGELTIKDVTRPVQIPFSFDGKSFVGRFSLNRRDYGVGDKSWILSDDVRIQLKVALR